MVVWGYVALSYNISIFSETHVYYSFVCVMMGLVRNYPGLMTARVFLGLAEGG